MQGLEIAKNFYERFGKPMLEKEFSAYKDRIAVGLVGEGSECLGYDDEISIDHDYSQDFCLFITQKDYDSFGFQLERAYSKLPKEFMGLNRSLLSPVGGNRRGVIVIEEFYTRYLGVEKIPKDLKWWLFVPSTALLNASNGQVFTDELGVFSQVRNELLKGYPEDVRRKKLAYHIIFMAQSGQYNYSRLIERKEYGASQLAVFEFVKNAISTIYLLNNKYEPFYKWAYKGLRSLELLGDLESALIGLTEIENTAKTAQSKMEIIEDVSALIIRELKNQGLTRATCNNLETHGYSVLDTVKDNEIRNMNIME